MKRQAYKPLIQRLKPQRIPRGYTVTPKNTVSKGCGVGDPSLTLHDLPIGAFSIRGSRPIV